MRRRVVIQMVFRSGSTANPGCGQSGMTAASGDSSQPLPAGNPILFLKDPSSAMPLLVRGCEGGVSGPDRGPTLSALPLRCNVDTMQNSTLVSFGF